MKTCLHCKLDKPIDEFAAYKDADGHSRPRNVCLICWRIQAADKQARYKERHGDLVRKRAREARNLRYWTDPEFRQKCIDDAKK
jgi:hypothetical protein